MRLPFLINTDYSDKFSQVNYFSLHLNEQFRGYYICQESQTTNSYISWDTSGNDIVKINPEFVSHNLQKNFFLDNLEQQIRNYYIAQKADFANYYLTQLYEQNIEDAGFGIRFINNSLQIRKRNENLRCWLYAIYNIKLLNKNANIGIYIHNSSNNYIDNLSTTGDLYYDISSGNNNLFEIQNTWTTISNGNGNSTIDPHNLEEIKFSYISESSSNPIIINAIPSETSDYLWLDTELYSTSSKIKSNEYLWVSDETYDSNSGYNKTETYSYVNSAPINGQWIQINRNTSDSSKNTKYIGEIMVIESKISPTGIDNNIYECTLLGSDKPTFDLVDSENSIWIRTVTTNIDDNNLIKIPMTTYAQPNTPTNYNYYRLIMHSITNFENNNNNNDHCAVIKNIYYEPLVDEQQNNNPYIEIGDGDGDSDEDSHESSYLYSNIVQIHTSNNQISLYLPSEVDFIGVYKKTNNLTGFHTQIEFYFDSSIKYLFENNYFIENIGPLSNANFNVINYSDYKAIALSCFTKDGMPSGIGEIILEANNTYKLIKDIPKNIYIPNLIEVKFPGIIDYSLGDFIVKTKV